MPTSLVFTRSDSLSLSLLLSFYPRLPIQGKLCQELHTLPENDTPLAGDTYRHSQGPITGSYLLTLYIFSIRRSYKLSVAQTMLALCVRPVTPTSVFSLQDFLKVFEGTRLFGFGGGLLVVLQHPVDVWLRVETIAANGGGYGRLWAKGNKQQKIQRYWKGARLITTLTSISFSNQSRQHKRNMLNVFLKFTRWCHDVTLDQRSLYAEINRCEQMFAA